MKNNKCLSRPAQTDDPRPKIQNVLVGLAEDSEGEVIVSVGQGNRVLPLICVSENPEAIQSLRRISKTLARKMNQRITLVRYSGREVIEHFDP